MKGNMEFEDKCTRCLDEGLNRIYKYNVSNEYIPLPRQHSYHIMIFDLLDQVAVKSLRNPTHRSQVRVTRKQTWEEVGRVYKISSTSAEISLE